MLTNCKLSQLSALRISTWNTKKSRMKGFSSAFCIHVCVYIYNYIYIHMYTVYILIHIQYIYIYITVGLWMGSFLDTFSCYQVTILQELLSDRKWPEMMRVRRVVDTDAPPWCEKSKLDEISKGLQCSRGVWYTPRLRTEMLSSFERWFIKSTGRDD